MKAATQNAIAALSGICTDYVNVVAKDHPTAAKALANTANAAVKVIKAELDGSSKQPPGGQDGAQTTD